MLKLIHLPLSTYITLGLGLGIVGSQMNLLIVLLGTVFITFFYLIKQWSELNLGLLMVGLVFGYFLTNRQIYHFNFLKTQAQLQTFDLKVKMVDLEKIEDSLFKSRLVIQVIGVTSSAGDFLINQKIAIYVKNSPNLNDAKLILIKNIKLSFNNNWYFEKHLIKSGLAGNVFVENLEFEILPEKTKLEIAGYKKKLLNKLNLKMQPLTKHMFNAIFAGYKSNQNNENRQLKKVFQAWGIIHYLARSGLHLVIMSSLWDKLCRFSQIGASTSNLIILLVVLIFYLLTWSGLPFMRALIMIVCLQICRLLNLQTHLLHILNLSCILTLLYNPICLFFLDFQLSFLLTYGLVLFNEIIWLQKPFLVKNC